MKRKKVIRSIFILAAWIIVISGITTLLIAANGKQKKHFCREVIININGTGEKVYIQKDDISREIEKISGGSLTGRPVASISLEGIEKTLEINPWVRNAELFFDTKDILHVVVEERQPIARVFTNEGNSFYIDSSGQRMPLLDKVSARLPVVTGFSNARKLSAKDSVTLNGIRNIAKFLYNNEFWNAQVGEIDVIDHQNFQLIPVIGDHIINIGNADNIEDKLERLFVFYKQVLSKVGFNKYSAIDVRFDGQVVAVSKGERSAIDSVQLKRNIEDLMHKTSLQDVNEDMLPQEKMILAKVDSVNKEHEVHPELRKSDSLENIKNRPVTNPKKTAIVSKTTRKTTVEPKRTELRKPKAVMKKRTI